MNEKELNIALGKLFNGIELDTHKVELGLVDDLDTVTKNILNKSVDYFNDARKLLNFAEKAKKKYQVQYSTKRRKMIDFYNKLDTDIRDIQKLADKVEAEAKKMGLNANDIPQYKNYIKIIDRVENNKKGILTLDKDLLDLKFD